MRPAGRHPHASSEHTEATLTVILRFNVSLSSCMAGTQWPAAETTLSLIRQNEAPGAPHAAQPGASGRWGKPRGKAGPWRTPVEGCGGAGGKSQGGTKWDGGCPLSRHRGAARRVGLEEGVAQLSLPWPLGALAPLALDLVVDSTSGDCHTPRASLSESPRRLQKVSGCPQAEGPRWLLRRASPCSGKKRSRGE